MILPDKKIQVFISSACGDEPEKQKYNYVREGLKRLIESTGFADVYVFESEGASTNLAGQHYTFALEDSDVCIFLIDNKDGVPEGVQKEIEIAKKNYIKSLFYFCDQFEKNKTPLEKSLKGSKYAKSVTIHDFKDFIKSGAKDLINDLVMAYKEYCKGRLVWDNNLFLEQSSNIKNLESTFQYDNMGMRTKSWTGIKEDFNVFPRRKEKSCGAIYSI